ncbi:hypothetical protein [Kribbella sp. VKM Ac-2568]|uniref:ATP-dependent DNA ligase n=1 Tax=Kribbella sp. VKM Ac-2568 TaxID=2512219 RepID=UPI0018EE5A83
MARRRVQSTSRASIIHRGEQARIWSRQRKDLTGRFPDIAAAAARQLPDGCVLDGQLVILGADGRLSFDALQRRLVTSPAKERNLVTTVPASYVAFDLLAIGGVDLRTQRWTVHRRRLEQLTAVWTLPLQVSQVTADLEDAKEWFDVLPAALGVEGLVVKGTSSRYVGGRREWLKVNSVGVDSVRAAPREHVVRGQGRSGCCGARQVSWTCGGGLTAEPGLGLVGPGGVEARLRSATRMLRRDSSPGLLAGLLSKRGGSPERCRRRRRKAVAEEAHHHALDRRRRSRRRRGLGRNGDRGRSRGGEAAAEFAARRSRVGAPVRGTPHRRPGRGTARRHPGLDEPIVELYRRVVWVITMCRTMSRDGNGPVRLR